jgi:Ca-activated chloride channel family protein
MRLLLRSLPIIGVILLWVSPIRAENYLDAVEQGNEAYLKGDYQTALEKYHVAETDLPESPELEYNMAGALHHEGKYEEAVERYSRALNSTDIGVEGRAHYNLGNTYFRMQDYQNAILAYQETLDIDPSDVDAKFNLELARKMLKEQMQQQEQDQQQEQQQQQQQEQQQQQQDQQQQDQQQQEQQQQDQQQEQQQNQQQQQQPDQPQEMSKEDAERILNALRDDEQEIQNEIRRHRAKGEYQGKDW